MCNRLDEVEVCPRELLLVNLGWNVPIFFFFLLSRGLLRTILSFLLHPGAF